MNTLIMRNLMRQVPIVFHSRFFHQSHAHYNVIKAMQKVMKGSSSKKKHRYTEHCVPANPQAVGAGAYEGKRSVNAKRVNVLNKLFMQQITDLMATGENSPKFLGHKIEISYVRVWSDFKGLNVYWIAKGTKEDEEIEQILNSNSKALRHELTQLRVVGIVPKITFVKDKHYAKIAEIDRLLSEADFGEDYIPVSSVSRLKSELQINLALDADIKNKIKELDDELECHEQETPLPPMPDNVFGLNHGAIMKKVLVGMKKAEAAHRTVNWPLQNTDFTSNNDATEVEFLNSKKQKEAFREFLLKQEIMKAKLRKLEKNDKFGLQSLENSEELEEELILDEDQFKEEKDFLEEYDEPKKF